jgi:DNA-binding FadR family transcriptional regulator
VTVARGLTAHVVSEVARDIIRGELPVGTVLAPEEVCHQYAVSRTVVREAVRVLQHKGMVAAAPRAGTRVLDQTAWNTLDPDVIGWRSAIEAPRQMRELLQMRRAVEPLAAALAARRASGPLRSRISEACVAMQEAHARGDWDALNRADASFHLATLTAAGNAMIAQIGTVIAETLHLQQSREELPQRVHPHTVLLHVAVAEAVLAGAADDAHAGMATLVAIAEGRVWSIDGPSGDGVVT